MVLLPTFAGVVLVLMGIVFLIAAVIEGEYLNNTAVIMGHALLMGGVMMIWKTFFATPNVVYFMGSYMVLLVAMLLFGNIIHAKLANKVSR